MEITSQLVSSSDEAVRRQFLLEMARRKASNKSTASLLAKLDTDREGMIKNSFLGI
jgi:hypothetical protein